MWVLPLVILVSILSFIFWERFFLLREGREYSPPIDRTNFLEHLFSLYPWFIGRIISFMYLGLQLAMTSRGLANFQLKYQCLLKEASIQLATSNLDRLVLLRSTLSHFLYFNMINLRTMEGALIVVLFDRTDVLYIYFFFRSEKRSLLGKIPKNLPQSK
jgi:hypothetical protein